MERAHRLAGSDETTLDEELDRLLAEIAGELRFDATDSEAIAANVALLSYAARCFNVLGVRRYGGRVGPVRGAGLVEQVVGAAFQTFGDVDPHPGPFAKAALLLRGVTQGHPFEDGNKRTGWLLASYYLEHSGQAPPADIDRQAAVDFCVRVSAGAIRDVREIQAELERLWGSRAD